jgi:hypothetical protein
MSNTEKLIGRVLRDFAAIEAAGLRYRETLREAVRAGVTQVDLAAALGVSREKIRADVRLEAQRDAVREHDTTYRAERKTRAPRKPWPECDCTRPTFRSLFQHDNGCRATIVFDRASTEQKSAARG